ncbi:hypothetical protein EVAR_5170_1 [Eumeta japonica]|uniref:Uncharacterized protein n=1 Tax=Eumeta variegata TaxID=151549 RepID=A0A4C1V4L5_EUMVA|nr:hypothetical protein EVAR_5170_1 [Eumeta japonica]
MVVRMFLYSPANRAGSRTRNPAARGTKNDASRNTEISVRDWKPQTAAEDSCSQRRERIAAILPKRRVVSTAPKNDRECNTHVVPTFTHILAHEHFIKDHLNFASV